MSLVTWETDNGGLISVSYDGVTSTVLRLSGQARDAFFYHVVDKWEHLYGPIADALDVPRRHVAAIIRQESGGNEKIMASNGDGGAGLMQITGGNKIGAGDLLDPANNLRRGIGMMRGIRASNPANVDFPALASIYNAGSPWIVDDPPHYVPPGTAGAHASNRPWTNEAWLANGRQEKFLTHWGFCTSPGYIDSVVSAQNEYILRNS